MKLLRISKCLFISMILIFSPILANAQDQTVGLFVNDQTSFNGYTLFAPMLFNKTYLIDNDGLLINSWESASPPALSAYLLENGHLLRTLNPGGNATFGAGGAGGRVEEYDWDGNLVWEFKYSSTQYRQHHDIEPMPNGNILLLAWEFKTGEEAIAAGRNPDLLDENSLWPEHIIEVVRNPANLDTIVWEWHVWDHLIQDFDSTRANYGVVADHPERIDLNYNDGFHGADWLHGNAVDYNEALDQIIICVRRFSEFWIIDHSTTTEDAAGHSGGKRGKGGDILYRWGNPEAYRAGTAADRQLFKMHDAQWIGTGLPGAGNVLVFNNGQDRPGGDASSVDEITPPLDSTGTYIVTPGSAFGPEEPTWTYMAEIPGAFYSQIISGAQRLPNGNTLICDGVPGTFFEVTRDGTIVWEYVNPVTNTGPLHQGEEVPTFRGGTRYNNMTFRADRYAPDYPAFAGKDLTPGAPIELPPVTAVAENGPVLPVEFQLHQNRPNPFNPTTTIRFDLPRPAVTSLAVYNVLGQMVAQLADHQFYQAGEHAIKFDATNLSSGVYVYELQAGDFTAIRKMMLIR